MEKLYFTMVSTVTFEVDKGIGIYDNAKEAFDKGELSIVSNNLVLISPDGTIHDDEEDIEIVKSAIEYGLKEKG